ncbi:DMT family transporter [Bacillus solimangrovi]|uniref:Transporter n=1 Tax=Bacillus solimangrovi TaxID=1305675 RepID=A0A1E5LB67_9BACI|nr:DMT family transporter [Bacillus solimangrovi]OEH91330.1 transporter [Bacillus solimangrovi]
MSSRQFFTHPIGILIAAIGATFLWGSAFPFIKLSYSMLYIQSDEIGEQILFAGYRFFLASILLIVFLLIKDRKLSLGREMWRPLIIIGLFQTFLQYIFFYIGLSLSTGIQGSIIAGTTSFFQILFAHFMYKDDAINGKKIIGLLIGFTGVVLVNITKGTLQLQFGIGEFLLILAMISGAFGNILARNGAMKMNVIYMTAFQMLISSIGLLLVGMTMVGPLPFSFNIQSGASLLYLAVLSAGGFLLWNNVMKYNQVGKVSMYLFLIPVFGVFLSAVMLGESLHMFVLLGLACVTSGIIIVNRK